MTVHNTLDVCFAYEVLKALVEGGHDTDSAIAGLIVGHSDGTWYCEHGLIVAMQNDYSLPDLTLYHAVDPRCIELAYETTELPHPLGG